jgi:hypothetical protein
MSLHGTGSSAPGSWLHSNETTCHGRVAKAERVSLVRLRVTAGLRRLRLERGADGIGDG